MVIEEISPCSSWASALWISFYIQKLGLFPSNQCSWMSVKLSKEESILPTYLEWTGMAASSTMIPTVQHTIFWVSANGMIVFLFFSIIYLLMICSIRFYENIVTSSLQFSISGYSSSIRGKMFIIWFCKQKMRENKIHLLQHSARIIFMDLIAKATEFQKLSILGQARHDIFTSLIASHIKYLKNRNAIINK